MALTIERKKQIVEHVHQQAQGGLSMVAAEYAGLTVRQMTALRHKARDAGVFIKVVKNSLARKAFEGTNFVGANERLSGQLVYFIGKDAPGIAARLARDFAKENDKLKVRVLAVSDTIYGAEQLDSVASLPTKDEAIALFMSCLKAPVGKLVRTIAALESKLNENAAQV